MMVKRKANLDDGCNPELVAGAVFDGELEIPVIHAPAEIVIPSGITPFSKREKAIGTDEAVGFFEKDPVFSKVLINPSSYVEDSSKKNMTVPFQDPSCSFLGRHYSIGRILFAASCSSRICRLYL